MAQELGVIDLHEGGSKPDADHPRRRRGRSARGLNPPHRLDGPEYGHQQHQNHVVCSGGFQWQQQRTRKSSRADSNANLWEAESST